MLGTFPKFFFSKGQLPKSLLAAAVFEPVQAAALSPLAHCSRSVRPHCSLWRLRGANLTFGKLPLKKWNIWEVALGKMPLGKYPTPTKYLYQVFFQENQLLIPPFKYNTPYYRGLFFHEKSFYKKLIKVLFFFNQTEKL